MNVRRLTYWIVGLIGLIGCGQVQTVPPTTIPVHVQAVIASSTIVKGPNRLSVGIMRDGSPVNDPSAQVVLKFFFLGGTEEQKLTAAGSSPATYFGQGLPAGIYVTYPTIPEPGPWGIEAAITLSDGITGTSRLRIDVFEEDPTPAIGSIAPIIDTPTVHDGQPLAQITSDPRPNPALYQTNLRDALANGKPTLILFGTPGFCKTAMCSPNVRVLGQLQTVYEARLNVIHVETYQYPFSESVQANPPKLVPAMQTWNLASEPWTFLIGANGMIYTKFEGGITTEELTPLIDQILKTKP